MDHNIGNKIIMIKISDVMKITFLGTSHGVPSEKRSCSSILLEVGETHI